MGAPGPSMPRHSKYMRPLMRRAPVRPTPDNLEAIEKVKSFQDKYRQRIRETKVPFLRVSRIRSIPTPLRDRGPRLPTDMLKHLQIRTGDRLRVCWGPDTGKTGLVLDKHSKWNTVILEGCGLKERNRKTLPGMPSMGGPVHLRETPIHVTNLTHIDPVTKQNTSVKLRRMLTGEFVRLSYRSGSAMPPPLPVFQVRRETEYWKANVTPQLKKLQKFMEAGKTIRIKDTTGDTTPSRTSGTVLGALEYYLKTAQSGSFQFAKSQ